MKASKELVELLLVLQKNAEDSTKIKNMKKKSKKVNTKPKSNTRPLKPRSK